MAWVKSIVATTVAATAPIPLDWRANPTNISIQYVLVTGPGSWQLQGTLDDITASTYSAASGNWFSIGAAVTASSIVAAITQPYSALRVNVTALTAGSLTISVMQAGGTSGA